MQYERWAPVYERIRAGLGFSWEAERRSAAVLKSLLPPPGPVPPMDPIRARLEGRDAVVVGLAPRAGPPPLWRLPDRRPRPALLAADGAAAVCLGAALVPDLVVTDLDGPVAAEVGANAQGALVVLHAHGDNLEELKRWVPEFSGERCGSWAGPPDPPLLDEGGFTDGDRAVYLAEAGGARRILLWGFDLRRRDPDEPDPDRKLEKMRWAEVALDHLATTAGDRMFLWEPDGRIEPYRAGPRGPATQ